MENLWNQAHEENIISHGENVKRFRFVPSGGVYNMQEVYQRADALRLKIEKYHPKKYAISVAVRDKTIGGWRSGKFSATDDDEIYIWSPEEYDKEFNNVPANQPLPELQAEMIDVFVKRIA
jgi:hypothetical protein